MKVIEWMIERMSSPVREEIRLAVELDVAIRVADAAGVDMPELRKLLEDERLKSNNDRIDSKEWFLPDVEKTIVQFTKAEIIKRCDTAGICFAPVARPEDLFEDPQLNQGAGLLETTFPDGTKTKVPRLPIKIGSYDFKLRNDPPAEIGADSSDILSAAGFTEEEIRELKDKKVITFGD